MPRVWPGRVWCPGTRRPSPGQGGQALNWLRGMVAAANADGTPSRVSSDFSEDAAAEVTGERLGTGYFRG